MDTILFSLLILRGLCDSQGRVWHCHPDQFYAVEVTVSNTENISGHNKKLSPASPTLALLKLLPSVTCLSPTQAADQLEAENKGKSGMHYCSEQYTDSIKRPVYTSYQYILSSFLEAS